MNFLTYKLVKLMLENTGWDCKLISLRNKQISGCVACLKCVGDNVCKVQDDFREIREMNVSTDAYVIGAPSYNSALNALTHAFLERWFQCRYRESDLLREKAAQDANNHDEDVCSKCISSIGILCEIVA